MWICNVRFEVTPGFLLLTACLFYLDRGIGILPWGLLGCALHEAGHVIAGAIIGGKVNRLTLSVIGAELRLDYPRVLSYWEENLVALAGPVANLITGAAAAGCGLHLPAILSLGIGGFNLLPILPLDGGRVLWNVLSGCLREPWPERITVGLTGILSGVLLGVGMIIAAEYANVTLLLTSGWLLVKTLKKPGKKANKNAKKACKS